MRHERVTVEHLRVCTVYIREPVREEGEGKGRGRGGAEVFPVGQALDTCIDTRELTKLVEGY